jgi:hypothetical protein
MMSHYKYISKPYTLDELVNGNPFFKIHCDFFNDLYNCKQEEDNSMESNSVSIDHLELIFNDFLNFISLLIYDKSSYNDTLKKISLKSKELENFEYLLLLIPYILCHFGSLSDPELANKVKTHLDKVTGFNYKLPNSDNFIEVRENYFENLENILNDTVSHDLIYFFDLSQIKLVNDLSTALSTKRKRKGNSIEFISTKTESIKSLDTSIQVLLFEELMKIENWELISSNKKGQILSLLIGKNDSNIKKVYLELGKKKSQNTKKFLEDREKASEIIKEILG